MSRDSRLYPEIITDILLRLPAKPLLRFRSVSKFLCSLIDSQDFINSHLNRSIETKTHKNLILFSCPPSAAERATSEFPYNSYAIDLDDGIKEPVELSNLLKVPRRITTMLGSCNGLLLLLENDIEAVLWNPFTRRYKKLLDFPFKYSDLVHPRDYDGFGLWYDACCDDYKLMRILHQKREVWVYSLRSNSWRRLGESFPYNGYLLGLASAGNYLDGSLHWLCSGGLNLDKIVVFELATEKFHSLALPLLMQLPDFLAKNVDLCVLEGRLCLSSSSFTDNVTEFDFYVGEKHGLELIWTKVTKITYSEIAGIYFNCLKPLSYSKDGEKILLDEDCRNIIWYDFEKKTGKGIEIHNKRYWLYSTVCLESLVSPGDDSEFDGLEQQLQVDEDESYSINRRWSGLQQQLIEDDNYTYSRRWSI